MHTISIQFTDGTADTAFYIGNEENPNTGAPDFGAAAGILILIAAAAAIKKR